MRLSPLFQLKSFSNLGDGRRFYTAVKYQNYFMDKCSVFIMILHIFSCRRFCFWNAWQWGGKTLFPFQVCALCKNRKMKTDKKNVVVEYLLFEDACIFVTFKDMLLAIGTNPISCLLPDSCSNIPLSWKLIDGYFCLHDVIQVSFHNFFITRATTSSFGRMKGLYGRHRAKGAIN